MNKNVFIDFLCKSKLDSLFHIQLKMINFRYLIKSSLMLNLNLDCKEFVIYVIY